MDDKLIVCGTRGSFPVFGKKYEIYGQATSCYVIKSGGYAIVLDCGTGLVNAVPYLRECRFIDVILTHIHYDHIMGLYTIDNPFGSADVRFYGNFDAWTSVSQKSMTGAHSFWPALMSRYIQNNVDEGEVYSLREGYAVSFRSAVHGDGAMMASVTKEKRRICFTGDNEYTEGLGFEQWISGCDLLIFDGSYDSELYKSRRGWGHSSWETGCRLARENGVKKLLITHFSSEEDDEVLARNEAIARQIYENSEFAKEGSSFDI